MALGGKVNDGSRAVLLKQAAHEGAVADIAMNEDVSRIIADGLKISQIAGVGQLVEIDQGRGLLLHPLQDEVGPDETSASSDQDGICHVLRL